jgi:hypothetical protein
MSPASEQQTALAALLGGNAPKPVIGRKVVSLNTNGKYAVDRSRPVFLNKKTRKKMRPVVKLDRNGNVKYRTAINLVDAIPATQKAALRARRAARKRTTKTKTKRSSAKTKRSSAKTKRTTKTKRSSAKTKTSATETSKRSKRSKRKASAAATNKATTQQPRRNPFARFLTLDKNNPAVRTLKNTFDAIESRRVSIVKRQKKK